MSVPKNPTPTEALQAALRYADSRALMDVMTADVWGDKEEIAKYPAWVVKCGQKVARAHFPKAYAAAKPGVTNAYKLGLALGMMQAGEAKLGSVFSELKIKMEGVPTEAQLEGVTTFLYGANSGATLPKDGSSVIPEEIHADLAKFESEMDLEAKGHLHAGISDAHLMLSGKNAATSTTLRYTSMIVYWRVVEMMTSMEQLHEFLTKIYGVNVVGTDIKGTRQLCHRIGKRFKSPGRPKKLLQAAISPK